MNNFRGKKKKKTKNDKTIELALTINGIDIREKSDNNEKKINYLSFQFKIHFIPPWHFKTIYGIIHAHIFHCCRWDFFFLLSFKYKIEN